MKILIKLFFVIAILSEPNLSATSEATAGTTPEEATEEYIADIENRLTQFIDPKDTLVDISDAGIMPIISLFNPPVSQGLELALVLSQKNCLHLLLQ